LLAKVSPIFVYAYILLLEQIIGDGNIYWSKGYWWETAQKLRLPLLDEKFPLPRNFVTTSLP